MKNFEENLKGKRVKLDSGKTGTITHFMTKEETAQCKMWGQWIKVLLDDGTIVEDCYGYTILNDNNL